jgi:hypothetical protein
MLMLAAAVAGSTHALDAPPERDAIRLGPWDPPRNLLDRQPRKARPSGEPDPERDPEGYRRWEAAQAKRARKAAARRGR